MQAPEQGLPELREWLWHHNITEVHVFWLQGSPVETERGGWAVADREAEGKGEEREPPQTTRTEFPQ